RAKAVEAVDHRKDSTAGRLEAVAGALREAAHKLEQDDAAALGGYAKSAANEAEKVARYLREKDVQSLTRDAETFARRHPEVFLGGAFVAGVLAARFLRSSTHRGGDGQESPREAAPGYQAGFEPFNPPHFEPTGGQ
ncbi:MAG TPA: hypothetical protein VMR21_12625, partial [Vicinamibacteria bacterium]|nr:hypothetical protein [Vicinamibacteria bacterium]